MKAGSVWSADETAQLCEMKAANCGIEEMMLRLDRSDHSINERWRWFNLTDDQRRERRKRINALRNANRNGATRVRIPISAYNRVVPPDVFAERNRRINTPRTMACELMGDPPPGYSALDRKRELQL